MGEVLRGDGRENQKQIELKYVAVSYTSQNSQRPARSENLKL